MERQSIKVSFITVNYNGLEDTKSLLGTIFSQVFPFNYEVIVIDNGSVNNEFELIQSEFPKIKGLYSKENFGFAGGNNLGIRLAAGTFLYFLNNDTLLPDSGAAEIQAMIDFCNAYPTIGGLTPKIKYAPPLNLMQFAGSTALHPITIRNKQIGYQKEDSGQYNVPKHIPYFHGAAMFVPRRVVERCGLLPTCYFLYYEELDWSCAISQEYLIYYFPQAVVYHRESASTGVDSPFKTYYMTRNRMIFVCRQRKGLIRILALLYLSFVAYPIAIIKYVCQGKGQHIKAVVRGWIAGYHWLLTSSKT